VEIGDGEAGRPSAITRPGNGKKRKHHQPPPDVQLLELAVIILAVIRASSQRK